MRPIVFLFLSVFWGVQGDHRHAHPSFRRNIQCFRIPLSPVKFGYYAISDYEKKRNVKLDFPLNLDAANDVINKDISLYLCISASKYT